MCVKCKNHPSEALLVAQHVHPSLPAGSPRETTLTSTERSLPAAEALLSPPSQVHQLLLLTIDLGGKPG